MCSSLTQRHLKIQYFCRSLWYGFCFRYIYVWCIPFISWHTLVIWKPVQKGYIKSHICMWVGFFFYNYKPLSSIIFPWSNFCTTATHTIKANCHHSFVHLIFYFLYYAVHNFIYIYMGNNTCLPKCSDVILCGCYKHSSFPFCLLFSGFLSNRITIITLISFDTLKKDFRKQGKTPKQTGDINGLLQH